MGGGRRGGVRTDTLDRPWSPKPGEGGARQTLEWSLLSSSPTPQPSQGFTGPPLASWVMDGDFCLRPTPLPSDFLF